MAIKLGMEARLYYGTAGATATTELINVKDVTLNLETGEADVTTRGNQGWRATVATLKNGTVEFEMIWDTGDAGFAAIKDAYFNNTAIALAILDGANGEGLDADFSITNFSRNEPLEEAITVSVTAKPTYSTRAPAWKEAGA
ncbi:MAG TPA: phage tail tube protein [Phycisphaerae bacterium]|nr:phage tail tube protein [Phycisphaerae bacterium]HOM53622.1 phage tail tube protein [Phycisphaerae bacterium]HON68343.1 phage tail tube protein [Phycisphaerae bacterium]HPP28980.1 phage tail tube protein [Phycisphaerae bacterium]HPZ96971.1 phage tail tube protein [Phycisphaerae bacterium]